MAGRIFSIGRLIASIIIRYSMIEIIVPAAVMLIIVDIMVEEGLVNSITEIVKGSGLTVRFMFKFFADRMISDCMTFDYDFFQWIIKVGFVMIVKAMTVNHIHILIETVEKSMEIKDRRICMVIESVLGCYLNHPLHIAIGAVSNFQEKWPSLRMIEAIPDFHIGYLFTVIKIILHLLIQMIVMILCMLMNHLSLHIIFLHLPMVDLNLSCQINSLVFDHHLCLQIWTHSDVKALITAGKGE